MHIYLARKEKVILKMGKVTHIIQEESTSKLHQNKQVEENYKM